MLKTKTELNNEIRECQSNLYSFWKSMASMSSGVIIDNNDYLFAPLNSTSPVTNPVFPGASFDLIPQELLSELHRHLSKDNTASWWHNSSLHSQGTLAQFAKRFANKLGPVPIMYFDLNRELPQENKYLVERWQDPKSINDIAKVVAECFQMNEHDAKIYQLATERNHNKFQHFYVRGNETIVAVGSLYFADDSIGCYNLAVLPAYRRRGLATAIHVARLKAAKEMGYRHVTLQATPMAAALDKVLGFKQVAEVNIFW